MLHNRCIFNYYYFVQFSFILLFYCFFLFYGHYLLFFQGCCLSQIYIRLFKTSCSLESVKWRALRALVPSMLACPRARVPKFSACPRAFYVGVPSCPRARISGVPSCHRCWRALVPACPNSWRALVPSMLACPRAFDVDVQDTLEGCDP